MGSCRVDNRKRSREYNKLHYDEIRVRRKPYFEAYRISGEKAAYDKKWRQKNHERKKKSDRAWYEANKEYANKRAAERNKKHWDEHLRACRETNKKLSPSVVRGNIWKSMHIKNPTEKTIEAYRLLTLLRREYKQLKQEVQNGVT
jgi:phage-related minor tail protein